jgi:activator of HSP90 ATPase
MKDFKKYYIIHAEPEIVYAGLTNPYTIKLWTGEEAIMSEEEGSEFELWGGSISGKNIRFEKGKQIIQQWYFEGQETESIVTIKLHAHKQGTSVEVKHTNIPDEAFDDISEGWSDAYMGALSEFYDD